MRLTAFFSTGPSKVLVLPYNSEFVCILYRTGPFFSDILSFTHVFASMSIISHFLNSVGSNACGVRKYPGSLIIHAPPTLVSGLLDGGDNTVVGRTYIIIRMQLNRTYMLC